MGLAKIHDYSIRTRFNSQQMRSQAFMSGPHLVLFSFGFSRFYYLISIHQIEMSSIPTVMLLVLSTSKLYLFMVVLVLNELSFNVSSIASISSFAFNDARPDRELY